MAAALPAETRAFIDRAIRDHVPVAPTAAGSIGLTVGGRYVSLARPNGALTPAGRHYQQHLANREGPVAPHERLHFFEDDAPRRFANGREEVRDRFGHWRTTRRWDPAANGGAGGHQFTRFGRQWGHSSVRYIVEIPVTAHFIRPNGRIDSYTHQENGERFTVPVTSDAIGDVPMPADLRVVRDVGDHDRQKRFIHAALVQYLLAQPRDGDGHIVLQTFDESDAYYTLDESALADMRNFFVSTETVVFRGNQAPYVETILNRPLRHFRDLPGEMLWKADLVPEATQDLGGQCVKHQLLYCVRRRSQADGQDRRNGERYWSRDEDIEPLLDEIERHLYPGHYEGGAPDWDAERFDEHGQPIQESEERQRHRAALAAYLPAWKREGMERKSCIFRRGAPREYEELRKNYVTNKNLTRGPFNHLGSFAKALSANTPARLPVEERLWYFFGLFPETFRCYRRSGKVLGVWLDYEPTAPVLGITYKEAPYRYAGWREVGVTSKMVLELGKRLNMPVYILHNDVKLHQFLPPGYDAPTASGKRNSNREPAIVFNVWGNHAYFYEPGGVAANHASKLKVHERAEVPRVRLAVRGEENAVRTRFADMRPFDATEFIMYTVWLSASGKKDPVAALVEGLARAEVPILVDAEEVAAEVQTWSGTWYSTNMTGAYEQLLAAGLTVHRKLGAKPSAIVELSVRHRSNKVARVRVVDSLFEQLRYVCDAVAGWANLPDLHYQGESPQLLADRLCSAALVEKRQRLDREAVLIRQGRTCHKCGATGDLEVHHLRPVSQGGDSRDANLVGLCRVCHGEETETLAEGGMRCYRAYYSQVSPRIGNLLMRKVRIPKAWINGVGADPFEDEEIHCLDLKGCRRNAIFSTEQLPVFGPADAEVPFDPLRPNLRLDFYWVRDGRDDGEHLFQGPNLYCRDLLLYMLEVGVVTLEDVEFGLLASRHVPGEHFRAVFNACQLAVDALLGGDLDERVRAEVEGLPKKMFNSMFGLWNRPTRLSLSVRRSGCVDDMRRVDVIRSSLGSDGVADCIVKTRIIGCETAFPLGMIALQKELVAVHRMKRALQSIRVDIRGVHTDGIFYCWGTLPESEERRRQERELDALLQQRHRDGTLVYARKPLPLDESGAQKTHLVPSCPQKPMEELPEMVLPRPKMRVLEEYQILEAFAKSFGLPMPISVLMHTLELAGVRTDWAGQVAHLIVNNGGGLVTGPAGTGKSLLLSVLIPMWRQRRPKDTVVVLAPTHAAARLLEDGRTLQRAFHLFRYGKVRNHLFVVDEVGMVALSAIGRLAEWKLMGARFVLVGDFHGQFKPIQDPWERPDMESADVYRQLAHGLHIRLSTNRRASKDPEHWWFLCSLYQFASDPSHLPEDVWAATRLHPWDGELTAETRVFAISHRLRTKINQVMNERFVRPRLGSVLVKASGQPVPGTLNQPQDMWLVPGQILQGCSPKNLTILNGVHYEVKAVTDSTVSVQMVERYQKRDCAGRDKKFQAVLTLGYREASDSLRLLHCSTYRSAQGCTIAEGTPVLLMDATHLWFDHRTLIVGLSRVEVGAQLRIATAEQQLQAFGWCGRSRPAWVPEDEAPQDALMEKFHYEPEEPEEEEEDEEEEWRWPEEEEREEEEEDE